MHPVLPRTTVRGPAALTISFMTRADSQPWQVRWPDVKYSSSGAFLTPLIGSRTGTGASNIAISGVSIAHRLLGSHADPQGVRRRLAGLRRLAGMVDHLPNAGNRHLAAAEPDDEADDGRALRLIVQRRPDLVGEHPAVEGGAHGKVPVDHPDRLEPRQER